MSNYIIFNGDLIRSDKAVITAENRSFRYGDGIFETMRVVDFSIELAQFHFERLFSGMQTLQFDQPRFTGKSLNDQIKELCVRNNHSSSRVRLMVFRGDGGLYNPENNLPNYIIQTSDLKDPNYEVDRKGLSVDIFPNGAKSVDEFSNLKSNNFLIYIMAAFYAKMNQLDDCMVLNCHGRICDSTISNVFCIKDGIVFTAPLSEGCIAGTMRRYLIENLARFGFTAYEKPIDIELLENADEIFLTNAISRIRWVEKLRNRQYENKISSRIYNELRKNIS